MTSGSEKLITYLQERYPQISKVRGLRCRAVNGTPDRDSIHRTGRALDIMIPVGLRDDADSDVGDPIANFLMATAEDISVEYVGIDEEPIPEPTQDLRSVPRESGSLPS